MGSRDARLGRKRVIGVELDAAAEARHGREPAGDDGGVVLGLVLEDPQLRIPVGLDRAVAVEVVGLEVDEHGDAAAEHVDVLQLEGRELADDELPGLGIDPGQRPADVTRGPEAEDRAQELGRRRLAVRAGDADEVDAEQPVAELDLAPDRDPARPRDADEQLARRDARALHEHVHVVEQAGVAVVPERPIGPHDLHPAPLEQVGGALPGARHPEHERAVHGRK